MAEDTITPRQIIIVALLSTVAGFILGTFVEGKYQLGSLAVFRHDFLALWCGFKIGAEGGNAYDLQMLQRCELEYGGWIVGPVFYPPHYLIELFPFLSPPFHVAWKMWLGFNIFALNVSFLLTRRLYNLRFPNYFIGMIVVLLYTPVVHALQFGQISLFITVLSLLALDCFRRNQNFASGIFLALATIKPHLVYLFIAATLLVAIKEKRYAVIWAFGGALGLMVIALLSFSFNPIRSWWMAGNNPLHYTGVSLAFPFYFIAPQTRLSLWLPCLVAGVTVAFLATCYGNRRWLEERADLLFLASIATSPYAWIFDYSVGLPVFLVLVSRLIFSPRFDHRSLWMIGILLVWFCAVCFFEINDWVSYHLWWFAIPLFLLRAAQRRTRSWEKGDATL